jgi:hypothetical protein
MGNPIHVLNPMGTGWEKSLLHCKMGMGWEDTPKKCSRDSKFVHGFKLIRSWIQKMFL